MIYPNPDGFIKNPFPECHPLIPSPLGERVRVRGI
jgi:hypothetical protein